MTHEMEEDATGDPEHDIAPYQDGKLNYFSRNTTLSDYAQGQSSAEAEYARCSDLNTF